MRNISDEFLITRHGVPIAKLIPVRRNREKGDVQALVPGIWPLEVVNVLKTAERRQRNSRKTDQDILSYLEDLAVEVDDPLPPDHGLNAIMPLGWNHGLTAYDTAYL